MQATGTILVGTDLSPLSQRAVEAAVRLAPRLGCERVVLEHVVNTSSAFALMPYSLPDNQLGRMLEEGLEEARQQLDALEVDVEGVRVEREARLGLAARSLAEAAAQHGAGLIVIASHGYTAMRRTFLGSVAGDLVRIAHVPVLVVGEARPLPRAPVSVLAAVDLSPVSTSVLEHAVALLGGQGRLTVLSLFEHPLLLQERGALLPRYVSHQDVERLGAEHRAQVEALVARVPHPGVEVRVEVMSKAPPPLVVLETAAILQPELIVCGTSGHNALHRMILGSTATRVLAEAPCPVLVVPPATSPEASARVAST
jgi:nucleotide-binding universal stress UspA family protein